MKSEKMNSRIISLISQDLTEICGWDGWSPWKNRAYSPPPAPPPFTHPPKSSSRPSIQTGQGREAERERKSKSIPIGLVIKSPSFPRNPLWEVSKESLKDKNTILNIADKEIHKTSVKKNHQRVFWVPLSILQFAFKYFFIKYIYIYLKIKEI